MRVLAQYFFRCLFFGLFFMALTAVNALVDSVAGREVIP
jgi:hypothetical protein